MRYPPRIRAALAASEAIANALDFHHITDEIRAGRVLTEWAELVGPKIAQRTRPDGIVERTLWVEVANSAWMHELSLLRPQLLRGLRERLGHPPVLDELKFRIAGRTRRPAVELRGPRQPAPAPAPPPLPATGAARDQILAEAEAVDDDELRELIARVRIAHDK
ncbi:MAG TPA: DUF721 domain-containing protein [Kofleriaceae bacterium]